MSRKCELSGKGPMVGHKISHAQNKTKRRQEGRCRHGTGGGVGGLRRLLLGLVNRLAVLLLVLRHLLAGLVNRDVAGSCDRFSGTVAGVSGLLLVAGHSSPHGRHGSIAQGRRVIAARGAAQGLLDGGERVSRSSKTWSCSLSCCLGR